MKIGILINTFYKGKGMDYVAEQQARELADSGHDITILTFDNDFYLDNIPVKRLGWPKNPTINLLYRLLFPLDMLKIRKYSCELKTYDLIIAHFYPMTYLAYKLKKTDPNIKYIYYNHGFGNCASQPLLRRIYLKLLRSLSSISISNADAIISISYFIKKQLFLESNVDHHVIHNKVSVERFTYNRTDISNHVLSLVDALEGAPKYLYVGTLSKAKGIDHLIKSFTKVLDVYPAAKLLLVGTPTYGFSLSNYVLNEYWNNAVYHLGHQDSHTLGYLYHSCDVSVSASSWESFNLPLVEAQLLGKPVVAYRIGAHEEVVKDQETGILVEPFNTDKFAEAMIQVYKKKDIMGEMAKKWAYQFSTQNSNALNVSKVIETWCKL